MKTTQEPHQKKPTKKANKSQRKGQRKRQKNIWRTWTELNWTDIINMSESVTLWILRKFNWWINWLNERMNVCPNEWMNEWMNEWHKCQAECRAGQANEFEYPKAKPKRSEANQTNCQLAIFNHIHIHIHMTSSSRQQQKLNRTQNWTAHSSTQQFSSQIEVKSVKNTNRHAQN